MILNSPSSYHTSFGAAYVGDSLKLLSELPDNSLNLVITSPPFALLREKEYGNKSQDEYLDWLSEFAKIVLRKLKPDGSFVMDVGGAYQKGLPVRSLYNFKIPVIFCEEIGFYLAEDFYWYNPSKLPSPIEWVNKRKIRAKDSVNTVWWFSKTPYPKSDITKVLNPYSERMQKLLENPERFYTPKVRPSGHDIGKNFGNDNGGAIPSNLLQISNSESNSNYQAACKKLNLKTHPARFPPKLPEFFISFLTDPGDIVLDIFAGSNTTGFCAEQLKRKWLAFDNSPEYVAMSVFRFVPKDFYEATLKNIYKRILNGESVNVDDLVLVQFR
ncbi:MAG: site-specific DNA-methyltransferase [Chitinophagaceae bacterium]|nr:site-specific DNA-methyltransferase [Chitinophagaceae bacterium]